MSASEAPGARAGAGSGVDSIRELGEWEAARCPPDTRTEADDLDDLVWIPARVPGTAAAALRDAGLWAPGDGSDLDAEDWWFRTRFDAAPATSGEEVLLRVGGVATVADVFLNGTLVASGESMFEPHLVEVGTRLEEAGNELAIRCRALAPLLAGRRRPRARWRTRLAPGGLRFYRTMLLGRAPGFAPEPAAVGPWRPVRLERRRHLALDRIDLRPRWRDGTGLLRVALSARALGAELGAASLRLTGPSGEFELDLDRRETAEGIELGGELELAGVAAWWPHTHGSPALHEVSLRAEVAAGPVELKLGRVGFRKIEPGPEPGANPEETGLDLHLNGERIFARGAVWTPPDPVGLAPSADDLRDTLLAFRAAGLNMVRVPGTAAYESPAFYDLCDELGILVWQDFMFANFDYPLADERFRAGVEREAETVMAELGSRPSLAVLCGNSEVEQQAAMFGAAPTEIRSELFSELLPRALERAGAEVVYVPSAPCGGALPFRTDRGIANYYGVGGYRRPLEDARRAGVRFAAECLAIANVPDDAGVEAVLPGAPLEVVVHHPAWKAGVPRDVGSGWDFDDVRDHYLQALFEVDPGELRRADHGRYLRLSRQASGEVMAAVFGEWRRRESPCGGGLVLWWRDLVPGAGWGLLDSSGAPKVAYHHLRRALAPLAVWATDEGLNGVALHLANDRPDPLVCRLRVGLYRDFSQPVGAAEEELELPPNSVLCRDLETMLGRFADPAWAYRFGPPQQDLIVASLEAPTGGRTPLSQAVFFPAGRPLAEESAARLGLEATLRGAGEDAVLALRSERFVYGLRIGGQGVVPDDDAICLEPLREREVRLRYAEGAEAGPLALTALNLSGSVTATAPTER